MELLIVDDEAIAIQGISMVLDWEEFGIDTVWTATSIEEARAVICDEDIDFLLCDIEMRSENGLHLVDWVNKNHPAIQCIIVTGHVNFEYTRKVLELGVTDYLNKPLDARQLRRAMQKAVRLRDEYYRDHEMQQKNSVSIERHFFRTLLREGEVRSRQEIREEIINRRIGMPVDSKYCMLYLKFRKWNDEYTGEDKAKIGFNISLILMQEYLKKYHTYAQRINTDAAVVCFAADDTEIFLQQLESSIERFTSYCDMYFLCKVCVYIKGSVYIEQFADKLKELEEYDKQNLLHNKGAFRVEQKKRIKLNMVFPDYKIWRLLLENGSYKELNKSISNYMDSEYLAENATPERLGKLIRDFEYMFAAFYSGQGSDNGYDENERIANLQQEAGKSISQCRDWMFECVACAEKRTAGEEKNMGAVDIICRYINSHIEEEISRNTLAGLVYMSPDHMTRVFKKTMGMTISDYILDKKMENAANLLVNTNFSISYIASNIGYSNISHFSGAFKKKYDMTPSEYRKENGRMSD